MVAIRDMEIPDSCAGCRMKKRCEQGIAGGWREDKRVDDCPLVEIVTCKDCEYWDKDWAPRVPDNKEYHFCPMIDGNTAENFYCEEGSRKNNI